MRKKLVAVAAGLLSLVFALDARRSFPKGKRRARSRCRTTI